MKPILKIFVTEHCSGYDAALTIIDHIKQDYPQTFTVEVVYMTDARADIPDRVFATPTYMLDNQIVSLGNPRPEDIAHWVQKIAASPSAPSRFAQGLKLLLKRWRYQGRYFGHSGIFVRKEIFEALGGFRDYDLLEDYDFTQRMEKQGATLFLPHYITASARPFQNRKLRAAISWMVIYSLYRLGVSPNDLVNFYYG
ncbi:MAG TPA: hypothetical protein P5526_31595 [Anaerolineae bacterium]|nr:hypothetical protein [Anaerolineae bacterium]